MSMTGDKRGDSISWPAPVLRVGLRWDGGEWTTTGLVLVPSMTLPHADVGDPERMTGFWVDSLDDGGRVHYRQRLSDPLAGMESFGASGEITRLTHPRHVIDIEVLVPDDVPAAAVRIISHRGGSELESVDLEIKRSDIGSPGERPTRPDHDGHNDHDHEQ